MSLFTAHEKTCDSFGLLNANSLLRSLVYLPQIFSKTCLTDTESEACFNLRPDQELSFLYVNKLHCFIIRSWYYGVS